MTAVTTIRRISMPFYLIFSALYAVVDALAWYAKGSPGLEMEFAVAGSGATGSAGHDEHASVLSMIAGDLIGLTGMLFCTAMLFTSAEFLHRGAFGWSDASLAIVPAIAAMIIGRRIQNRLHAAG
jgi:hypothetical protein